jgi:hypothetical protein
MAALQTVRMFLSILMILDNMIVLGSFIDRFSIEDLISNILIRRRCVVTAKLYIAIVFRVNTMCNCRIAELSNDAKTMRQLRIILTRKAIANFQICK